MVLASLYIRTRDRTRPQEVRSALKVKENPIHIYSYSVRTAVAKPDMRHHAARVGPLQPQEYAFSISRPPNGLWMEWHTFLRVFRPLGSVERL